MRASSPAYHELLVSLVREMATMSLKNNNWSGLGSVFRAIGRTATRRRLESGTLESFFNESNPLLSIYTK